MLLREVLLRQHMDQCSMACVRFEFGSGDGFHLYQAKRPQVSKPPRREREPKDPSRRY